MDRKIKKALSAAMVKPDQVRKDEFIRMYRRTQNTSGHAGLPYMLKSQLSYIRIPVWIISFIVLLVGIYGIHTGINVTFAVSAIMPFVSGIALVETFRSRMYGMTEMESVTLMSVRGILFARLSCIGIIHILLLAVMTFMIGIHSGYGVLMTGVLITIPYLLTSVLCMELERTRFGRYNTIGCIAVSAAVSLLMIGIRSESALFAGINHGIWYSAVVLLIIMECVEIKKTFRWEEYAWN